MFRRVLQLPDEWQFKMPTAEQLEALPSQLFPDTVISGLGKSESDQTVQEGPCGHVFKKGEPIYRCKTCGLDETCVICARCYHASEHEGHDIMMSISRGGGGCCDCGDFEAWKRDIRCRFHPIHSADTSSAGVGSGQASNDSAAIKEWANIMAEVIEYVVLTLGLHYFTPGDPLSITLERNVPSLQTLEELYPTEDLFSVLLWNDESHSFQEVIDQVSEAVGGSDPTPIGVELGRRVAEDVDQRGYGVVETSTDKPRLIRIARILSVIKLGVTIRPTRDVLRERIAERLVVWILEIVTENPHLRRVFCEQLMRPLSIGSILSLGESQPVTELDQVTVDRRRKTLFLTQFEQMKHQIISEPYWTRPATSTDSSPLDQLLYLDMLLVADLKAWNALRAKLREVYVATLVADNTYKHQLAARFVLLYPKLVDGYLSKDREAYHNIVMFSVQILTTPSIARFVDFVSRVAKVLSDRCCSSVHARFRTYSAMWRNQYPNRLCECRFQESKVLAHLLRVTVFALC